MADESGVSDLYEFLYHATSKIVHFSPHVLIRMGWGDVEKGRFVFSTKNFYSYYDSINRIYGAFIFTKFCSTLVRFGDDADDWRYILEKVKKKLDSADRWPELVTFEEMNLNLKRFDVFVPLLLNMILAKDDYANS